jgi:drug/metabolite transporter (DMT)-like permease
MLVHCMQVVWSVFWFGHHVAFVQALGAVLVFGGLSLDIHDRFSMIPA